MNSTFTDLYAVILDSLIEARNEKGVTQQELAERLKKPQSFVSKYERKERRIDIGEFIIIAQCIGVNPIDLMSKAYNEGKV